MKKTTALLVLALFGILTSALLANSNVHYASAHLTKQFGKISILVGWANEPPLAGQLNTIVVGVTNSTDNKPVANAVAELQSSIKKGGDTKPLDLIPQEQEGMYGAQVMPSQIGQYEMVFKGTVNGQAIDGSIALDTVEDPKQLTFPATGGAANDQISSGVIDQFKTAITDLSSQVDGAKASADQAQQSAQNAAQSAQSIKASADGAYMFAMVGVGVGVAGIVIGVVALSRSREEKVKGEKIPRF